MTDPQPTAPPGFEEWVEHAFTRGYREFHGLVETDERFTQIDPVVLAGSLTRLFESPAWIAERYTDEQIADGVWFIFGVGSEYLSTAGCPPVPVELRRRWLRAVATMYRELFLAVCDRRGTERETDNTNTLRVDTAVYMIWDMGQIECGFQRQAVEDPGLVDDAFGVLEAALALPSYTCRKSALHGLGHLAHEFPERVVPMIDAFLARTHGVPGDLKEYALAARRGYVQ